MKAGWRYRSTDLGVPPVNSRKKMGKATTMQEHVAHEGKNPYNGIKNVGIEPTTEVRAPPG